MELPTYYIEKTSGTAADALLAIGFASLIGELLRQQHGTAEGILIQDRGSAYTITIPHALDLDWQPREPIYLLLPLESNKQREKRKGRGKEEPLNGFQYDDALTKRASYAALVKALGPTLQTPEARLRKAPELERIEDYAPDPRLIHYQAINIMGATDTFNELALRWRQLPAEQQWVVVRLLVTLFAQPINDIDQAIAGWQQIARAGNIDTEPFANALQMLNPASGKGAHFPRAGKLSIKGQNRFWLLELLKFRGFFEAAAPLSIQDSQDRKTYVLLPRVIEFTMLQAMMQEFRSILWPTTVLKLDILASLRFAQVIVEHHRRLYQAQAGYVRLRIMRKKHITSLAQGFEVASYKYLGNAYATMHIASLGLPGWLPELTDGKTAEQAAAILKEHIQLIYGLRTARGDEGAEEYTLLRLYRDFLSGHDLAPFFEFATTYGSYFLSVREKRRYVVQLTTHGLEQLIMNTTSPGTSPLSPIFEIEGFQNVATAIREATVRGQYRRTQQKDRRYEVRYGLGQDLKRLKRHRDPFVKALCDFLQDYNAETSREEEKVAAQLKRPLQASDRRERRLRRMISTNDVQTVIALIDQYGAELIGSLLITFGYAFDSGAIAKGEGTNETSSPDEISPEMASDNQNSSTEFAV